MVFKDLNGRPRTNRDQVTQDDAINEENELLPPDENSSLDGFK